MTSTACKNKLRCTAGRLIVTEVSNRWGTGRKHHRGTRLLLLKREKKHERIDELRSFLGSLVPSSGLEGKEGIKGPKEVSE